MTQEQESVCHVVSEIVGGVHLTLKELTPYHERLSRLLRVALKRGALARFWQLFRRFSDPFFEMRFHRSRSHYGSGD